MITMGFNNTINVLNILQLVIVVPMAWLFMVYLQLDVIGYGIFKFINEVIICIFLIICWKKGLNSDELRSIDKVSKTKDL